MERDDTLDEKHLVATLMGIACLITGFFLTTNERFAAWGLRHGKATIWVKLLGPERALKLTRFFFGPLSMLLGLGGLALGFFD
jgi:hypothetical protein